MAGLEHDTSALAGLAESQKHEAVLEKSVRPSSIVKAESMAEDVSDDSELPTEEERHTLRRISGSIPWAAYLIAFIELAERFSYYGTTVVFTNFIQQPLPKGSRTGAPTTANGQAGALGRGQQASTGLTTFNSFWVYVIPLFGAYIADTRWGRFKTICISVAIATIGHILLVMSSIPGVINHANSSMALFVVAIVIMGLGTGGFKANISPLVAEQVKQTKMIVQTTKSGERVIVDPTLTTSRIYMYFYLFINIGALIGQIGMTYSEKNVGYWLAYLLPTIVFLLCPLVLLYGRNRYVRTPPAGSVLAAALNALKYAARGRWSLNPIATVRNMTASDFWDSVRPSRIPIGERPAWMTFDDVWVDELRRGFKACTVFLWFPIYWLTYNQLNNNLTSQAATMQTHGLPNDVLSNLDPFALIIFIPICDQFIYPWFNRMGWNFSPIKRITLGFFTGAASMIWAAVVQHYIYKTNQCGNHAGTCADADGNPIVSPLNVWIQTGAYVLIAFSEIFASITGLEYAFTKAPKNMRSLVMSVFLFMSAISSALGEAFVSLSIDPLLVWNYAVMGVLAAIAGTLFWISHRHLDAEEDKLNQLDVGQLHAE